MRWISILFEGSKAFVCWRPVNFCEDGVLEAYGGVVNEMVWRVHGDDGWSSRGSWCRRRLFLL